jgi:2-dehydro-3-deoxyphosphogluconate aldolase / (4S)-4-hydroxy-2-oxoglutarate aldolase
MKEGLFPSVLGLLTPRLARIERFRDSMNCTKRIHLFYLSLSSPYGSLMPTGRHTPLLAARGRSEGAMIETPRSTVEECGAKTSAAMSKAEVRARIEKCGVVPAFRATSAEDALYVAKALAGAGLPILEISMNTPRAVDVLSHVAERAPEVIVGAGSVRDVATAQECLRAGAKFLTSDGLVLPVVEFSARQNVVVFPGAFTPTEIVAAWNAGSDFVKVLPCDAAGGSSYVRSVKAALPDVPLIPAGGVSQLTARDLVAAGATALGIGTSLIPADAVRLRQAHRIQELARRFLAFVEAGRIEAAGQGYSN